MQRNSAEGIKAAAARWGAAITPALMATLCLYLGWRHVFLLFGIVGVIWAAAFWWWYRSQPVERITERGHGGVSWSKLVRSRSVWALGIQWFCHYYGFYFYITWLPQYLYQARGLNLETGRWPRDFLCSPPAWAVWSRDGRSPPLPAGLAPRAPANCWAMPRTVERPRCSCCSPEFAIRRSPCSP